MRTFLYKELLGGFDHGNYSREETIQGNPVVFFSLVWILSWSFDAFYVLIFLHNIEWVWFLYQMNSFMSFKRYGVYVWMFSHKIHTKKASHLHELIHYVLKNLDFFKIIPSYEIWKKNIWCESMYKHKKLNILCLSMHLQ